MRVAIANFSTPQPRAENFAAYWATFRKPAAPARRAHLMEFPVGWGFHIFALGIYLLDLGLADEVEFWDYAAERYCVFNGSGILRMHFYNAQDLDAYLDACGAPDLFINYGREGIPILERLGDQCFRVHVPCLRSGMARQDNFGAECYLVDDERFLDARSLLYVPVVNTEKIFPRVDSKEYDFVYIAEARRNKRHDILLNAIRGTQLTGHCHPVNAGELDVRDTHVTFSAWERRAVLDVMQSARIGVYAGDNTSNPAAMWECVAAGLPIVVNAQIAGGKHLVIPGVTGEFAAPQDFYAVMETVLRTREQYQPRACFLAHWAPLKILDSYLNFFRAMGWSS